MRPSQGRVPELAAGRRVLVAQLCDLRADGAPRCSTSRAARRAGRLRSRVPLSLDGGGGFADACSPSTPDGRPVRHRLARRPRRATCRWTRRLADVRAGACALRGRWAASSSACRSRSTPSASGTRWLTGAAGLVAGASRPYLRKPEQPRAVKPEALWEVDQARDSPATNDARERGAHDFHQQMLALFEHCDVLALPTAQVWPFDASWRWPREIAGRAMDTYHRWMEVTIYATFAGLPCIAVPAGFGAQGLPMGLQLIGRPRADAALLRIAARVRDDDRRHPRAPPACGPL
jgi:amidase